MLLTFPIVYFAVIGSVRNLFFRYAIPIVPFLCLLSAWAMTEVFVAERSDSACTLGYVTTEKHFGVGKWQSTVVRERDELKITVKSISAPRSWLFWVGLPIARYLQKRAWRRAIEEFRAIP